MTPAVDLSKLENVFVVLGNRSTTRRPRRPAPSPRDDMKTLAFFGVVLAVDLLAVVFQSYCPPLAVFRGAG